MGRPEHRRACTSSGGGEGGGVRAGGGGRDPHPTANRNRLLPISVMMIGPSRKHPTWPRSTSPFQEEVKSARRSARGLSRLLRLVHVTAPAGAAATARSTADRSPA